MLSSGARKDFLILSFIDALIETSKLEETKNLEEDNSLINRRQDYRLNKRIDRRLESIQKDIKETIKEFYSVSSDKDKLWTSNALRSKFFNILQELQDTKINIELLALFLLFANFADVARPLHDMYSKFTNSKMLDTVELMTQTNVAFLEKDMFELSYKLIARIKC